MRRPLLLLTILPALAAAGCEAVTSPSGDAAPGAEPTALPAGWAFTPGGATALTGSGSDDWPALDGRHVAWYRSAPADEQGLWVMELESGAAARVWNGVIRSAFDLVDGTVYWGTDTALLAHDIASGTTTTLTTGFRDYADISAGARYITGSAVQSSRRPLVYDRVTGEARLIPTPTSVPAARGWEEHILWTDTRNGIRIGEFYLLHIPTGVETRVTDQDQLLSAANSALSDGRAVYFARRFCPGPLEVYDLASGATAPLPLPAAATCPAVVTLHGDLLAYRYDAGGGILQLGIRDLATGDDVEFPVARPASGRVDADLDGSRLVHSSAQGLVLVDLRFRAPPTADAGGPYVAVEGAPVTLDGTGSSASDGTPLSFLWRLGDGTALEASPTPTHTWEDDGAATVLLTVVDQAGLEAHAETRVDVANAAPVLSLGSGPAARSAGLSAEAGTPVTLEASFSDPGLLDAPWRWSVVWEGGEIASGSLDTQGALPPVSWTPADAGEWVVTVRVEDKDGGIAELRVPLAVSENVPDELPLRLRAGSGSGHAVPAPGSAGIFPVVVFGSADLPVDALDEAAFRLDPGAAAAVTSGTGPGPSVSDVDRDGFPDLRLFFRARDLELAPGAGEVCLAGSTGDGRPVRGCAPVRVAGD